MFKIFTREKKEVWADSSNPDILWAYPLERFVDKKEPFSDLDPAEIAPNAGIKSICVGVSLGYILFLYYALVERHYGAAVAKITRWKHLSRLKLGNCSPPLPDSVG